MLLFHFISWLINAVRSAQWSVRATKRAIFPRNFSWCVKHAEMTFDTWHISETWNIVFLHTVLLANEKKFRGRWIWRCVSVSCFVYSPLPSENWDSRRIFRPFNCQAEQSFIKREMLCMIKNDIIQMAAIKRKWRLFHRRMKSFGNSNWIVINESLHFFRPQRALIPISLHDIDHNVQSTKKWPKWRMFCFVCSSNGFSYLFCKK